MLIVLSIRMVYVLLEYIDNTLTNDIGCPFISVLIALHTIRCKHWFVYLASLPPLSIKPLAVAIDNADT